MATFAWTQAGGERNSRTLTLDAWEQLSADVRSGEIVLHCENCRTPLRTRNQSIDSHTKQVIRTKHFLHPAGAPDTCPNRDHEGESDQHRELKSVVASAFESVKGIHVVEEYGAADPDGGLIRIDVAVLEGLTPRSLAEIQTTDLPVDVLNGRNRQRRRTIGAATDGWSHTTPWFAPRAYGGSYRQFPFLYLSSDGQRITDGVFPFRGGMGTDEDDPIEVDIDKGCDSLLKGHLIQVDKWWADRSDTAGRRGRRRRRVQGRSTVDRFCDRPTVVSSLTEPTVVEQRPMVRIEPRPQPTPCKLCGSDGLTFPTPIQSNLSLGPPFSFTSWGWACADCRTTLEETP